MYTITDCYAMLSCIKQPREKKEKRPDYAFMLNHAAFKS